MRKYLFLLSVKSVAILLILSAIIFYFESKILLENYEELLLIFNEITISNIIIIILLQTLFLSIGLPSTPLIILNFVIFLDYGFLISIISLTLSSLVIYRYSNFISNLLNLKNRMKVYFKYLNESNFFLKVFLSRFIIPFYFHNLIFGINMSNLQKFILAILFSDFISVFLIYFTKEIF